MSVDGTEERSQFSIEPVNVDGETRLVARGEIDLAVREILRLFIAEAMASTGRVVVDVSEVSFLDSTGLNELVRAKRAGCDVVVLHPQPAVRHTLKISGLDPYIQIMDGDHTPQRAITMPTDNR
jgi:anti-anti-sigma factor